MPLSGSRALRHVFRRQCRSPPTATCRQISTEPSRAPLGARPTCSCSPHTPQWPSPCLRGMVFDIVEVVVIGWTIPVGILPALKRLSTTVGPCQRDISTTTSMAPRSRFHELVLAEGNRAAGVGRSAMGRFGPTDYQPEVAIRRCLSAFVGSCARRPVMKASTSAPPSLGRRALLPRGTCHADSVTQVGGEPSGSTTVERNYDSHGNGAIAGSAHRLRIAPVRRHGRLSRAQKGGPVLTPLRSSPRNSVSRVPCNAIPSSGGEVAWRAARLPSRLAGALTRLLQSVPHADPYRNDPRCHVGGRH